jgi:hypothetical protein
MGQLVPLHRGVDPKELGLKAEKIRHVERLKEIEKVKEQREQRDKEKMEKEEEREIMQREEALIEAVELEVGLCILESFELETLFVHFTSNCIQSLST